MLKSSYTWKEASPALDFWLNLIELRSKWIYNSPYKLAQLKLAVKIKKDRLEKSAASQHCLIPKRTFNCTSEATVKKSCNIPEWAKQKLDEKVFKRSQTSSSCQPCPQCSCASRPPPQQTAGHKHSPPSATVNCF